MNRTEFNQWWADYSRRFPDTGRWVADLEGSVLVDWLDALSDIEVDDAMDVNRKLMAGDLVPIQAYQREQTPAIIRRHTLDAKREALAARNALSENSAATRDRERFAAGPRESPTGSARGFMEQISKLIASGMTARLAGERVFPRSSNERHSRVNCTLCNDCGWVDVWSNVAIRAAIECKPIPTCTTGRMCVLCSCGKGDRAHSKERFSHSKYCEFADGNPDSLREWITECQVADLQRRRHKEFDTWNDRATKAEEF